jgi:hypothetical protein
VTALEVVEYRFRDEGVADGIGVPVHFEEQPLPRGSTLAEDGAQIQVLDPALLESLAERARGILGDGVAQGKVDFLLAGLKNHQEVRAILMGQLLDALERVEGDKERMCVRPGTSGGRHELIGREAHARGIGNVNSSVFMEMDWVTALPVASARFTT